jgi:hypothetical protein
MSDSALLSRPLRAFMLVTDLGFLAYWVVTLLHVLPAAWLFKDYDNPILQSWNVSFLPLDLVVSAVGLTALTLARRGDGRARAAALLSLSLTSASGLMAVAFWTLRRDFDPLWWAPNLVLLLAPLCFLPRLMRELAPI